MYLLIIYKYCTVVGGGWDSVANPTSGRQEIGRGWEYA